MIDLALLLLCLVPFQDFFEKCGIIDWWRHGGLGCMELGGLHLLHIQTSLFHLPSTLPGFTLLPLVEYIPYHHPLNFLSHFRYRHGHAFIEPLVSMNPQLLSFVNLSWWLNPLLALYLLLGHKLVVTFVWVLLLILLPDTLRGRIFKSLVTMPLINLLKAFQLLQALELPIGDYFLPRWGLRSIRICSWAFLIVHRSLERFQSVKIQLQICC